MNHSWQGAGSSEDRPAYDDECKQEAARFLFCDINPAPRIRGINDVERCRKWIDVETDSADPDSDVISMLNRRVQDIRSRAQSEASNNDS
jgi:hypothetical protein